MMAKTNEKFVCKSNQIENRNNNNEKKPSPQNEDILVIPEMEYCQSKRMTIFLGSIYVYKGLLMVIF